MANILIISGSVYGTATLVAEDLQIALEKNGHSVTHQDGGNSKSLADEALDLALIVTSTTGAVSQGFLLGHREFRARAMVQRTRDEGIVAGMGSNELRLLDISLSSDIQVDDLVVTSGKSSRFPEGIPIGVVVSNEVTGGLFRDVRVRALASLSRLEELYIVQPVPADSASLVPVDSASDTDLPGATHRQNQNGSE